MTKLTIPEIQIAMRLHITTFHPNKYFNISRKLIFNRNVIVQERLYSRYFLKKVFTFLMSTLSFHTKKNENKKLKNTAHSNEIKGASRYSPAND